MCAVYCHSVHRSIACLMGPGQGNTFTNATTRAEHILCVACCSGQCQHPLCVACCSGQCQHPLCVACCALYKAVLTAAQHRPCCQVNTCFVSDCNVIFLISGLRCGLLSPRETALLTMFYMPHHNILESF